MSVHQQLTNYLCFCSNTHVFDSLGEYTRAELLAQAITALVFLYEIVDLL